MVMVPCYRAEVKVKALAIFPKLGQGVINWGRRFPFSCIEIMKLQSRESWISLRFDAGGRAVVRVRQRCLIYMYLRGMCKKGEKKKKDP